MKLSELTKFIHVPGDYQRIEFTGLANNSQQVVPGDLFIAMKGCKTDGFLYIEEAMRKGAVAALAESGVTGPPGFPIIQASGIRKAQGMIAAYFYGEPSSKLRMIGVTGTNGKTTVAHLIAHLLNFYQKPTGLIGTVWINNGREIRRSTRTTPDSIELQKILAEMVANGMRNVVMEVSSHALALERVAGIEFDIAVLTNINHDHFDFHLNYQNYLVAKQQLFRSLPLGQKQNKYAVLNMDDPSFPAVMNVCRNVVLNYGFSGSADIKAGQISDLGHEQMVEVEFLGKSCRFITQLPGRFNIYNILAASTVVYQEGMPAEEIERAIPEFPGVPGRYQLVDCGQPFTVMVDFAHNPAALENILEMAHRRTGGRRILVFGCEGEKDRLKRPLMGQVAVLNAEIPILTSDNNNQEEPNQIFSDVLSGIPAAQQKNLTIEPDRKQAIRRAVELAEPGDFIIVAGKGHERTLIQGAEKILFDDAEVLREMLHGNPS